MTHSDFDIHNVVAEHLSECKTHIDLESYDNALAEVKKAKSADTNNIYLLALEKQLRVLSGLDGSEPSGASQKADITKKLPEIIRCAIDNARNRDNMKKSGTEAKPAPPKKAPGPPPMSDRDIALQKRKDQFIQRAEDYLNKQEYQRALDEVRRIFVIDPNYSVAKKLEAKIERMIEEHTQEPVAESPVMPIHGGAGKSHQGVAGEHLKDSGKPSFRDRRKTALGQTGDEEDRESKLIMGLSMPVFAAAAVAVLVVVGVLVFFVLPSDSGKETGIASADTGGRTAQGVTESQIVEPEREEGLNEGQSVEGITGENVSATDGSAGESPPRTAQTPAERRAAERAERERLAAERAEQERIAAEQAEQERLAAERTEQERLTAERAEADRLAAAQAEQERIAAERAETERLAAERAEAERAALAAAAAEPQFFEVAEQMPEPVGGLAAILSNVQYPQRAIRAGIEGTVYIQAYIDSRGVVQSTEVVRGIGGGCDEAAARAVESVRFSPGMQRGTPVDVRMMIPVNFSLRDTQ
jgi:TonB family protein